MERGGFRSSGIFTVHRAKGTVHRCLAGEVAYRFLPPFFFPPLAAFFAIALIPPFTRGIEREELLLQCGAAASAAGPRLSAPRRFVAENFRVRRKAIAEVHAAKKRGCHA